MSMKVVKSEPLTPLDGNIPKIESISKQHRHKLEWANQSLSCAS